MDDSFFSDPESSGDERGKSKEKKKKTGRIKQRGGRILFHLAF
jgi:hypothetical protein